MNLFFIFLWIGGLVPAYRHARNNGFGIIQSSIQSIAWPADLGWILADRYCRDYKE